MTHFSIFIVWDIKFESFNNFQYLKTMENLRNTSNKVLLERLHMHMCTGKILTHNEFRLLIVKKYKIDIWNVLAHPVARNQHTVI